MGKRFYSLVAGVALASIALRAGALPARADDLGQRFVVNVAPVYLFSTGSDDNGPNPAGDKGIGYTTDNPLVSTVRFNYGLDFKIDAKTHLSYAHTNYGYQLGRILTLAPKTSFVSGSIYDYVDSVTLSRSVFTGFTMHLTYASHQRQDVTGLCLNQKFCPQNGVQQPDPLSIDEIYYDFGGSYDFGPNSRIGQIFTAAISAKYVPRPANPPSPNVALGGLGAWVGSQVLVPYSLTAKIPILPDKTFIPFINYTNLPVLYRDSAVPEEYRGIVVGFVKVVSKNVTLSYTNLNLQTCRCVARVPPPDNLRLAFGILSLDLHTGL